MRRRSLPPAYLTFRICVLWCERAVEIHSQPPRCLLVVATCELPTCIFVLPALPEDGRSVLSSSKLTALAWAHSPVAAEQASSLAVTFSTALPVAIQATSPTKESPSATVFCSTSPKSSGMYTAKRMGDTGDPCGIPISRALSCLSAPSMKMRTLRSVIKLSPQRHMSDSIPIDCTRWPLMTLFKADLRQLSFFLPSGACPVQHFCYHVNTTAFFSCSRTVRGGGVHPALGIVVGMGWSEAICTSTGTLCVHGPP